MPMRVGFDASDQLFFLSETSHLPLLTQRSLPHINPYPRLTPRFLYPHLLPHLTHHTSLPTPYTLHIAAVTTNGYIFDLHNQFELPSYLSKQSYVSIFFKTQKGLSLHILQQKYLYPCKSCTQFGRPPASFRLQPVSQQTKRRNIQKRTSHRLFSCSLSNYTLGDKSHELGRFCAVILHCISNIASCIV